MNDIDKGMLATPNLEQATGRCCEDRCSIMGGRERETGVRSTQGCGVTAQVGPQNGSGKTRLTANPSDPQAKDTEPPGFLSGLSVVSEDEEDACVQETRDLDAQLWVGGTGELRACDEGERQVGDGWVSAAGGGGAGGGASSPAQRRPAHGAALPWQSQSSQQSLVLDKELAAATEERTQGSRQWVPPALRYPANHLQEGRGVNRSHILWE